MSLHLIYRPNNFDEFVGNRGTIKTIETLLKRKQDLPHSWLFQGPSGCGKTTLARIVAEKLGCKADSQDFVELDIAQLTGVDTARKIRESMHYLPMESECRVWLLDEVHKGSDSFQNGMLKALEDTPEHVFFILCTTEPNKIIKTVRGRCHKFEVELLNEDDMEHLISWVLEDQDAKVNDNICSEIISAAEGCPREALVILDQVIDLPEKEMIGAIQKTHAEREVKELCQALLRGEGWLNLAPIIKNLNTKDSEQTRRAIIGYMNAVVLSGNKTKSAQAAFIFECFKDNTFYTGMPGIAFAAYNTTI